MTAPSVKPAPGSLVERVRASSPRGELVELPMFGRVWVELVGGLASDEIDAAVFARMEKLKLPLHAINMPTLEGIRDRMRLAWAVRDPDDHSIRAGTLAAWDEIDHDIVMACALVYNDVRERLSPIQIGRLSAEQMEDIRLGLEKKNPTPLLDAGVAVLTSWLLTTAVQPANSPTMPSSTGASP